MNPSIKRVPNAYVVPKGSTNFPTHVWGMKLGQIMRTMTSEGALREHRHEVEKLGFSLAKVPHRERWEDIISSLLCYRARYPAASRVPYKFVVPHGSSDFPEHLWGIRLGQAMHGMMYRDTYRKYRYQVEELGFPLQSRQALNERFANTLEALRCYRALHPTAVTIPCNYVVPQGSSDFPEKLWGMRLGRILDRISDRAFAERQDEVKNLGFVVSKRSERKFGKILEAIRCYRALYPNVTRIPAMFTVPRESSDYPEHLWGLKVGYTVSQMICRGSYRQHHSKVLDLGFSLTKIRSSRN